MSDPVISKGGNKIHCWTGVFTEWTIMRTRETICDETTDQIHQPLEVAVGQSREPRDQKLVDLSGQIG